MKKNIIVIFSVLLSVTISAQDRTPMDKIWEDISKFIPRQDSKLKVNHGDGVLRYVHNGYVGEEYLCTKDCDGVTEPFNDWTTEDIETANERNRKVFSGIFGAIRNNLDSLMAISEESYHFESHNHGRDTITYSICLKNSKDSIRKYKAENGSMVYPDAMETIFFEYTSCNKPCGKHVRGFGILGYNKNIFLPNRQSHLFDKESYLQTILPLLKRKDIKSWDFKWSQSADYDIVDNEEFEIVELIDTFGPKNAGQTLGTMFFIPREKTELAEAIFTAIDSVTLNYTDLHPEQIFTYGYNTKEWVMQYAESSNISQLITGTTGAGHHETRVLFGITPKGYYVAIADIENNYCIPKEWSVLKSFVNGEKEYIK